MKTIIKNMAVISLITIVILIITACTLKDTELVEAEKIVLSESVVLIEPEVVEPEITEPEVKEPTYVLTYEVKEKVTYLGEFKLTAYCSCAKCCGKWAANRPVDEDGNEIVVGASGHVLTAQHSIAVDPKVIPYGTTVIINDTEYVAEDCGGAIKGNRIDVYFNDHKEALKFGVQRADVYIKEVYE